MPEKGKEAYAGYAAVGPDFLKVYGLHLLQGREFRNSDRPGAPKVVIVNEAMSKKYWPGENPIGKRMATGDISKPDWAEVVGVMRDFEGSGEFYNPTGNKLKFMVPWAQDSHRFIMFNVRTSGASDAYKEPIRKAVGLMAPDLAVSVLYSVEGALDGQLSYFNFLRKLLVQIAGLGLLLSAIGIYGVVANLATERTREIGIRMALGAQPGALVWLFLKNGIQLALIGAGLGLAAAYFMTTVLARMIPVLPGRNPLMVAGVTLLLVAVAVVACWFPARRTTKVSPLVALRTE